MTTDQKKILGTVLFVLGTLAALYGVYATYAVYDANAQLAAMDNVTNGMLGRMAGSVGQPMKASYSTPIIILLVGATSAFGGWRMIGKAARHDASQ